MRKRKVRIKRDITVPSVREIIAAGMGDISKTEARRIRSGMASTVRRYTNLCKKVGVRP